MARFMNAFQWCVRVCVYVCVMNASWLKNTNEGHDGMTIYSSVQYFTTLSMVKVMSRRRQLNRMSLEYWLNYNDRGNRNRQE
jgi:IS30 family transposase